MVATEQLYLREVTHLKPLEAQGEQAAGAVSHQQRVFISLTARQLLVLQAHRIQSNSS